MYSKKKEKQWENVLLSSETKINLFGSNGRSPEDKNTVKLSSHSEEEILGFGDVSHTKVSGHCFGSMVSWIR